MTRTELEQAIKEHIVNCFGFCPLGLVGMIMADVFPTCVGVNRMENEMDTPLKRALHYVECYALHWPDSGAGDVAEELRQEIAAEQRIESDVDKYVDTEREDDGR